MKFIRIPLLYYQTQKNFYCQPKKSFSVSSTMRKAPGVGGKSDKSLNQDFVDFLMELSNYEKNVNRNTFKGNAYKKVKISIFKSVITKFIFLILILVSCHRLLTISNFYRQQESFQSWIIEYLLEKRQKS